MSFKGNDNMTALSCLSAAAAFLIFYYYDWCSVRRPAHSVLRWGFPAASILVLCSTGFAAAASEPGMPKSAIEWIGAAAALIGFILLIKALFFSLPAGTYSHPTAPRRVYSSGMYALCRHPGFPSFVLLYAGLALWFGRKSLLPFGLLVLLNLIYIILQDRWTFPHIFCDYADYCRRVPFAMPTAGSIKTWISERRAGKEKKQP